MLNQLFKSILEQDDAPIVVCDTDSVIVYMNPSAIRAYQKDLTGCDLKNCHNMQSNKKIECILAWFQENKGNNIVFTYHDIQENKDVYMVALRDEDGGLIGYYEKHMSRNAEEKMPYAMPGGEM